MKIPQKFYITTCSYKEQINGLKYNSMNWIHADKITFKKKNSLNISNQLYLFTVTRLDIALVMFKLNN